MQAQRQNRSSIVYEARWRGSLNEIAFGFGGNGFKNPFVVWNTRSRFRFLTHSGNSSGFVTYLVIASKRCNHCQHWFL